MNPRQRRGVLLLGLAAVGAVVVFVAVASYVSDVRSQVGPTATILQLTIDVPAFSSVEPSAITPVEVPVRWMPDAALRNSVELVGMVAGTDLVAGSVLQQGMLVPPPQLEPGQREIAILVDAETGVAGKIGPGSLVDILATFAGEEERGPSSQVIVSGARIIDVGLPTAQAGVSPDGAFAEDQVVPVTFALGVQEGLVLTYAEAFASSVRLARVGEGDITSIPEDEQTFLRSGDGATNPSLPVQPVAGSQGP